MFSPSNVPRTRCFRGVRPEEDRLGLGRETKKVNRSSRGRFDSGEGSLGKVNLERDVRRVHRAPFPRINSSHDPCRSPTISDQFGSNRDLGVRAAPGIEDPVRPKISVYRRYVPHYIEIFTRGIDGRGLRGALVRSWWTSASHEAALHVRWRITGAHMRRNSECPLRSWTKSRGRKRRTSENGPD